MPGVKKGQKIVCVPCGREVIVSSAGISRTTLWCCGTPMSSAAKAGKKAPAKKNPAKKTPKKSIKAKKK